MEIEKHSEELKRYGIKSIALIGSYAHNEACSDSDIDFLVEYEKGRGLFDDYSGTLNLLQDTFEREIDLIKPYLVRKELKPYILEGKRYEARI